MKSLFEEMGGTYHKERDYLIPDITLFNEENQPIGIWEQRYLRYLKRHRKVFYYNILTSSKLNSHLTDIDKQAEELYFRLVSQLAEKEGVTEKLKAENQMAWVVQMNSIRNRADEIVNITYKTEWRRGERIALPPFCS